MARNAQAHEIKTREFGESLPPGWYYFVHTEKSGMTAPAGIIHGCPCGCGQNSLLYFRGLGVNGKDEWDVTGEWPNVTLKPSIGLHKQPSGSAYGWHGYLENGVFVER